MPGRQPLNDMLYKRGGFISTPEFNNVPPVKRQGGRKGPPDSNHEVYAMHS